MFGRGRHDVRGRALHPTRPSLPRVASLGLPPRQGKGWSALHRSGTNQRLAQDSAPRRELARGHVKEQVPREGDGAPKSAKPMVFRASFWETRRAPFGAPARRSSSAKHDSASKDSPPHAHPKRMLICGVLNSAPGPAFVLCILRSSRPEAGSAYTKSSASSWQDLLVGPGGAPLPPERFVATKPAGAAPRPAFKTPLERAPQRTRWPRV